MINSKGINVELGRKYEFHSLHPDRKDICTVVGFLYDIYGSVYGVRVKRAENYSTETRWFNWIIKESEL